MINYRQIRRVAGRLQFPSGKVSSRPQRLDIRLDASLSMTSGDGSKQDLARELPMLLLELGRGSGMTGSVLAVRGRNRVVRIDDGHPTPLAHVPFDGMSWRPEMLVEPGERSGSGILRLIISDFLFPDDPEPLMPRWATGAQELWLVQLLDEQELNPEPLGKIRLVDIETEERRDLVLDQPAVDAYLDRLRRLRDRLSEACRTVRATLVSGSAAVGLEAFCQEQLVTAGLLELRAVERN